MHRKAVLISALLLAAFPAVAMANAGTPLMWASALHLIFGNAIIGVGEGLLLALLFRKSALVCMAIMIAANYFSAWLGGVYLLSRITGVLELDLYNAWTWLWYLVGITFLITLVLEWPFVALCLRKTDGWFWKSLVGLLVTQSVSYLALFGWYWSASGTSLYTDLEIVPLAEIALPSDVTLYYIDDEDDGVYAWDLRESHPTRVRQRSTSGRYARLWAKSQQDADGAWRLMAQARVGYDNSLSTVLLSDLSARTAYLTEGTRYPPEDELVTYLQNRGEVPRLDESDGSDWRYQHGFWTGEDLRATNSNIGETIRLAWETPFVQWFVRAPIQLPSDLAVFQLGPHQICVVDPNARKVALLVKGRGPVVTSTAARSE